jgi:hypothetical protein
LVGGWFRVGWHLVGAAIRSWHRRCHLGGAGG